VALRPAAPTSALDRGLVSARLEDRILLGPGDWIRLFHATELNLSGL
jgi:hypothetical protein